MKTIEKKAAISKALLEVWEWKDEVYNDVKDLRFKEKKEYYAKGLKEAAKILEGKIKTNPDGREMVGKAHPTGFSHLKI